MGDDRDNKDGDDKRDVNEDTRADRNVGHNVIDVNNPPLILDRSVTDPLQGVSGLDYCSFDTLSLEQLCGDGSLQKVKKCGKTRCELCPVFKPSYFVLLNLWQLFYAKINLSNQ